MCGIAGVVFKKGIDKTKLEKFKNLIKEKQYSRGPDFFGIKKITDNIFFFHNRLSIIDVNRAFQPMNDEIGVIVFNGEIYNFQDLKFYDVNYEYNSDTEVLLKGLNKEYIKFLKKTNSMFAFGYYNKISKVLTLARDRIGIKQVYYIDNNEVFAFASTITPLVIFSQKKLNINALWQYYQNRAFKAPNTIFEDIKLLEPGTYLEFDTINKNIIKKEKWWEREKISNSLKNEENILKDLDNLLHKSVKERLVSDVPVGAYLSGGVDSSLIVAIASKYYPNLETFTVSMKDKRYDESKYAKNIANKFGLKYHEIVVDANEFLNSIDEWITIQDDIVADPSALVLYKLSKLAKENGYKVMLSGEGSDELFGGYNSYLRHLKAIKFHKYLKIFKTLSNLLVSIFKTDSRKQHFILNIIKKPKFYGTALIFEPHIIKNMLYDYPDIGVIGLKEAMDLDIKDRLPNDLLVRTDRATMGASIEARVPFLAHQIVDYSAKIDERLFVKNNISKYLIKKIAEKYIPYENIYRKKVGFDLPIEHWFRNELKDKMYELLENSIQKDILNLGIIREIYKNHLEKKTNAAAKLWAFMSLELNYRYLKNVG